MPNRTSDNDLVKQATRGDQDALGELFDRHWANAWKVAYGIVRSEPEADDVAQQAFEQAFRSLGSFERRSEFATWLHRIVVHRALDSVRRESRRGAEPIVSPASSELAGDPLDAVLSRGVFDALGALSPERRAVLVLRYWFDYSLKATAAILEVPLGTVQSRESRALAELREMSEVSERVDDH